MPSQLIHANVVVVARQFNPTIFSQLWLVRNGIATEEDLQGESLFTPAFVQVRGPQYVLLVLPEQLQFAPAAPQAPQAGQLVLDKVSRIVELLPETPYVAIGLNFAWQLDIEDAARFPAFCRALFFHNNPLFNSFNEDNARFGGYLSKNLFGARLKLDVKPVRLAAPAEAGERILFSFNLHKDLGRDNPVAEMNEVVGRWNEALAQSSAVLASLEGWQWQ